MICPASGPGAYVNYLTCESLSVPPHRIWKRLEHQYISGLTSTTAIITRGPAKCNGCSSRHLSYGLVLLPRCVELPLWQNIWWARADQIIITDLTFLRSNPLQNWLTDVNRITRCVYATALPLRAPSSMITYLFKNYRHPNDIGRTVDFQTFWQSPPTGVHKQTAVDYHHILSEMNTCMATSTVSIVILGYIGPVFSFQDGQPGRFEQASICEWPREPITW